eukprot:TRINITY_DN745_c1_g2_i2.p1 TRINITY_DN745_c1_g2~~TRINITY_DN745_c1_g2_i2.p1  ORF type:complete len:467 (-),score=56.51 TRINITY_DN745_c1_g2_i2:283-1683(-)
MEKVEDEPLTPAGRFFLRPEMQQVINCVVGLKLPIDIDAIKSEIQNSLVRHPRFCSMLVRDKHGFEHWRRSQVELERHVFVPNLPSSDSDAELGDDEFVNNYIADLAISAPMDQDKPLWEVHVLESRKCCVLRLHHALGDGISLMSLFLACCRNVDGQNQLPTIPSSITTTKKRSSSSSLGKRVCKTLVALWFSLVYVSEFVLRILWVKDAETAISGGAGVELWPRKVATARFNLEDMKIVKMAVNGTINDVLFGILSSGLTRYLAMRSSNKSREEIRITGIAMVNTRKQPGLQEISNMMNRKSKSRWGNQFGFILLPTYLQNDIDDPLDYVRRSQTMLNRKKHSFEAYLSYKCGALMMNLFGPKIATLLNYRIISNTTFTISNVVGPQEEIMFAGNPITHMRVTSSGLPHAIIMHMLSYKGKADMQIQVAKDIIPDPHVLAKCFEDSLLEMKDVASIKLQDRCSS